METWITPINGDLRPGSASLERGKANLLETEALGECVLSLRM